MTSNEFKNLAQKFVQLYDRGAEIFNRLEKIGCFHSTETPYYRGISYQKAKEGIFSIEYECEGWFRSYDIPLDVALNDTALKQYLVQIESEIFNQKIASLPALDLQRKLYEYLKQQFEPNYNQNDIQD